MVSTFRRSFPRKPLSGIDPEVIAAKLSLARAFAVQIGTLMAK
jgi:hypothetical protein